MADRLSLQGGGDKEHSTGGRDKNKQITSIVKCLEEKNSRVGGWEMIGNWGAIILDLAVKKGFSKMWQHFSRDLDKVKE